MVRPIAVVACSLALTLPAAQVRAAEPLTDQLSANAEPHVIKALEAKKRGAYREAAESLQRAAFFTPNWRPLHFNLAVLAEAQGKIGVAVREYKEFRPYATPDEELLVDQRIYELTERRKRIIRSYRGQLTAGSIIVTLGVAGMAGGAAMIAVYYSRDPEERKSGLAVGGGLLILYGLLVAGGGAVPLSKAVKAKRELDGLALGPTRLRWSGGAGFTLKF